MVLVQNKLSKLNFNGNGYSTTSHKKKNTTLACWLCLIQEKSPRSMLQHHHRDHRLEFLSGEKFTVKNFFTISNVNELYACEDNKKPISNQYFIKIAILLESPVSLHCTECKEILRSPFRGLDHLHERHDVKKFSIEDTSLFVDVSLDLKKSDTKYDDAIKIFSLYVVENPNHKQVVKLGEYKFQSKEAFITYLDIYCLKTNFKTTDI